MNEQDIVRIVERVIEDKFQSFVKSDRYIIEKSLMQFQDGRNILLGTTTGTQIGTATTEKLAFHGSTPIAQAAHADQASVSQLNITGTDGVNASNVDTNFQKIITLVNRLRTDLINKGVIKGSA